jgi:WD40 repeat protein
MTRLQMVVRLRLLAWIPAAVLTLVGASGSPHAQTPSPQLRLLCSDPAARATRLAAVRNERERSIMASELADLCAQIDLPATPVHDTADPRPEASHTDWVFDARFSPDGRTIASGSRDGTVRFWDVEIGQQIRQIAAADPFRLEGRDQPPAVRRLAFVGDGKRLFTLADGDQNRLLDIATGAVMARPTFGHVVSGGFAPALEATRGGLLLVAGTADTVDVIDAATMQLRFRLPGHRQRAPAIAVSEAAGLIATARGQGPDRAVLLWQLLNGQQLRAFTPAGPEINGLVFSRDGARLAVITGGSVQLHQVADGRLLRTLDLHPISIPFDVAFTPDGNGIVTCMRHPILWDLAQGRQVRHFGPFSDLCHSIDISPDGRFMVTTAMGSDVRVWDLASGAFHRRLGRNVRQPR